MENFWAWIIGLLATIGIFGRKLFRFYFTFFTLGAFGYFQVENSWGLYGFLKSLLEIIDNFKVFPGFLETLGPLKTIGNSGDIRLGDLSGQEDLRNFRIF